MTMSTMIFNPVMGTTAKELGSPTERTLFRALKVLAFSGIPSLVIGGLAVRYWGGQRPAADVDLVVPNDVRASVVLLRNGFVSEKNELMIHKIVDPDTGVAVDTISGGSMQGLLALPIPSEISERPTYVSLVQLLNSKLSLLGDPEFQYRHAKDAADVDQLIATHHLDATLKIDPGVTHLYLARVDRTCSTPKS